MSEKTVFISYSHDSEEHRERVLGFSERLRKDGIETLLDQYVNGSPEQGWQRWMLDQLDAADSVLVVCTPTYYRRFRGHEEPGKGRGVDWEGALITQEIYASRSRTRKFVPIFLSAADENWIPEPLRSGAYYALTSESDYQQLYDFLLEQAGVEPQPVGALKAKPRRKGAALTFGESPPIGIANELVSPLEFVDDRVKQAAIMLNQARVNKTLTMRILIGTLDRMFERDTFRWEPSVGLCTTQEWDYRLHSALQILYLIQEYDLFVEKVARQSCQSYRDLMAEVSRYCQDMAAYLFKPPVGLAGLRRFVGTGEFINAICQQKKWFEEGVDPKTCSAIDPHLEGAIRLMKVLHDEFCGTAESSEEEASTSMTSGASSQPSHKAAAQSSGALGNSPTASKKRQTEGGKEGARNEEASSKTGIEVFCQKPWSGLGASPKCTITDVDSGFSTAKNLKWEAFVFIPLACDHTYRLTIRRPSDFLSFKASIEFSLTNHEVKRFEYESPPVSFMAGAIKPLTGKQAGA